MTDSPTPTVEQKKSRRDLLALVGAGGAAAVAALLGRSNGAEAAGPLAGDSNTSTPAVRGDNTVSGTGVLGTSAGQIGVRGESTGIIVTPPSGRIGVFGFGDDEGVRGIGLTGVRGTSTSGVGVYGSSNDGRGVWGTSDNDIAVFGHSGNAAGVMAYGKPGVHGVCYLDGGAGSPGGR